MRETRDERALITFRSGYNCAQAIFSTYCGLFQIDEGQAKSIAAGFGAGFGGLQKTCGAVSGALMLIGLRYHDEKDVAGSKRQTYARVREFVAEFEKKNETVRCLDLLGVDLDTAEGMKRVREERLFDTKCEQYIRDVCEIVERSIR
jgi:C_GCAxxG_C_C family probable redox protein